jgi:hypothetical protein
MMSSEQAIYQHAYVHSQNDLFIATRLAMQLFISERSEPASACQRAQPSIASHLRALRASYISNGLAAEHWYKRPQSLTQIRIGYLKYTHLVELVHRLSIQIRRFQFVLA